MKDWIRVGRYWYNIISGEILPVIQGGALPATDDFTTGTTQSLTDYSANWTNNNGSFEVQKLTDDVGSKTSSAECGAHWNADSFNDDQYAEVTVSSVGANDLIGCGVRHATSAATWYGYYALSSERYLFKLDGGVWTELNKYLSGGISVSDVMRIEAEGTIITPLLNGSEDTDVGWKSDSAISSGYAGLSGYNSTIINKVTDWEGGDLAEGAAKFATLTDTVGITDTLTKIGTFSRTLTEPVGITDTITPYIYIIIRPDGDITINSWTNELEQITNLYQSIDEVIPDDNDYIASPYSPSSEIYECSLENISDPQSSTGHTIKYRYKKVGSATINLTIRLMQGAIEIASWNHNNILTSIVQAEQTLTSGEADSITNYNDLRLRFEATKV